MLKRQFDTRTAKDDSGAKAAIEPRSFILHERSRSHYWSGQGLLSIKTFRGGRTFYNTGNGASAVDDTRYLILNDRQDYSIALDSDSKVESFCVFFEPGLVDDVFRAESQNESRLLDDPLDGANRPIRFFDRTYLHDDIVSPALFRLRDAHRAGSARPGWFEEQLIHLAGRLLKAHSNTTREAQSLASVRQSTREELYRRVHRARDFIDAFFDSSLALADIARAACLSPSHLLRTFRQVFHCTPHQYLTEVRMNHARRLLVESDASVTSICFSVGFESPSSFSILFRRWAGISPEKYRSQKSHFR